MKLSTSGLVMWRHVRDVLPTREMFASMGRSPRHDVLAGVAVAVVALPLALGFGVASGMGAAAGITTAVIAGLLAALFGGSHLQVSGPTGAMTVVLVPIVHRFGSSGVLLVGLLAGIILIALAFAKVGRYMAYVPVPVIEGFTIGIAAIIALQQVPVALGVDKPDAENTAIAAWQAARSFLEQPHSASILITMSVIAVMLLGSKWRPKWPFALMAVAAATAMNMAGDLPVAIIGSLPQVIDAPSFGFLDVTAIPALLTSAFAVAALAGLESLMSATVADAMSVDERHDSNRELFGQGIANVVAPLFGGVAATGAIARTAVNVRSGAVSRLAAIVHAVVLLLVVLVAAPLVTHIPLAALAGVLIATAVRMVETASVRALVRAGRGEMLVLVLTAAATLAFDLVTAVIVGFLLAGMVALVKVSRAARLDEVALHDELHPTDHHVEEQQLLAEHIVAYRIDGPLFFGAAHRFLGELQQVSDIKVVILRMSRVSTIDATGALVIKDAIEQLRARDIRVLVSGVQPGHSKPLEALEALKQLQDAGCVFSTTPEAIAAARGWLHRDGVLTANAAGAER